LTFWRNILIFNKKVMQQTFQLNANDLNADLIESVRSFFGRRKIRIVIEEVEEIQSLDQQELFREMEELRLSLKDLKVDPNVDFSKLADEMYL
jgi:hypothetical protein